MSDDSPLFVSAIELLAHSTELYTQGNARKNKFVILHLANAIELILKDRLVDEGISIYESNKPLTITIWKSFEKLEEIGVNVPERPVIELLVDDRNTIQHRFGFPDAETVYYYLKRVVAFFKRFLDEEYGVDLSDTLQPYLPVKDLAVLGLAEEKAEYAQLDRLFDLSPEAAILQAYSLLEAKIIDIVGVEYGKARAIPFWHSPNFRQILENLASREYVSPDSVTNFDLLRQVRNYAAHTAHLREEQPPPNWSQALDVAKDLLQGLERATQDGIFSERMAQSSVAGNSETESSE